MRRVPRALGFALARRPWLTALAVLLLLGGSVGAAQWWAQSHFQAARRAVVTQRYRQARAHVGKCLWVWPTSVAAHLLAARAERLNGEFEGAEECLKQCKRLAGGSTPAIQLEWYLLRAQRGEADKLFSLLWGCVEEEDPESPAILETLAMVYLHQGRLRRATALLNRWMKIEPDNIRALEWRSQARMSRSDLGGTVADCEEVLRLDPTRLAARKRLAEALMTLNLYADAEPHLEYLRRHDPASRDALVGLARCRIDRNDLDEARRLLDRALALDPTDRSALIYRGQVELKADRPQEAEPWLRRAVERSPGDARAADYLYRALRQQPGKAREAAAALERVKALRANHDRFTRLLLHEMDEGLGDNARVVTQAAELLLEVGDDEMALRWLQLALSTDPRYAPAHRLAIRYYQKHNQPDQVEYHRRALVALLGRREAVPPPLEEADGQGP
jgi:tetratricopeptide (TPR) repeat protein